MRLAFRLEIATSGWAGQEVAADEADCAYISAAARLTRSEEHTSELQSLMRISYAVFCSKKNINTVLLNFRDIHDHTSHLNANQMHIISNNASNKLNHNNKDLQT